MSVDWKLVKPGAFVRWKGKVGRVLDLEDVLREWERDERRLSRAVTYVDKSVGDMVFAAKFLVGEADYYEWINPDHEDVYLFPVDNEGYPIPPRPLNTFVQRRMTRASF